MVGLASLEKRCDLGLNPLGSSGLLPDIGSFRIHLVDQVKESTKAFEMSVQ